MRAFIKLYQPFDKNGRSPGDLAKLQPLKVVMSYDRPGLSH